MVGRDAEMSRARALLLDDAVPLLTVTGPGGVGKTRLALAVGHDMVDAFTNGAVFIDLAPVAAYALVLPTIAHALGVHDVGDRPLAKQLAAFLRPKQLLVILDNCEHVLGAAADIADLLIACPAMQILATSRAPLRVRGEHLLPVPPLTLPRPVGGGSKVPASTAHDDDSEAVTLFVQRARAVEAAFVVSPQNAAAVAEICVRLDGIPLALELAAARLRLMTPQALLALLSHQLRVLTGGERDLPARQRTIRETIAWSYGLLTPEHQVLFRRLAVFVGGFEAGAIASVAGIDPVEALDGAQNLFDQSLIQRDERDGDRGRFGLFETVREYGMERLVASGEEEAVRARHAAWCLAAVESAWPPRAPGPTAPDAIERLDAERANVRAALGWLTGRGEAEAALRLTSALAEYWWLRGDFTEGRGWLALALQLDGGSPALRASALYGAAALAEYQGDLEVARASADESLRLALAHGDLVDQVRARFLVGQVASYLGDVSRAAICAAATLAGARELGDSHWLAYATNQVASATHVLGKYATAMAHYDDADRLFAASDSFGRANVRRYQAAAFRGLGSPARAAAHYRHGMEMSREIGLRWGMVEVVIGVAALAADAGADEMAARLLGAAEALSVPMGSILDPRFRAERDWAASAARIRIGSDSFAAASVAGGQLSMDDAVTEAFVVADAIALGDGFPAGLAKRVDTGSGSQSPQAPNLLTAPEAFAHRFALSPREQEVLVLLVQRWTDKEIADALFISPRTVMTHATNIFTKLDVGNRREAAAMAVQFGLV